MKAIVPWAELWSVIEPFYSKGVGGRPLIGLQRMLRIHCVQHWFNLADVACEEARYDSMSLRRFVGIGHEPESTRAREVPSGSLGRFGLTEGSRTSSWPWSPECGLRPAR